MQARYRTSLLACNLRTRRVVIIAPYGKSMGRSSASQTPGIALNRCSAHVPSSSTAVTEPSAGLGQRERSGVSAGKSPPFVDAFGLWTDEQRAAAERVRSVIEERDIQAVRVSFPDLAGIPRGKSFMRQSFLRGFRLGFQVLCAPLLLGSADERVYDSFAADPPLGVPQFAGGANMIVVPDPLSFQVLPWAPRTAWLIGDCYFPDGEPCPIASRAIMKRAVEELRAAGFEYQAGLELEFYVFRIEDPMLGDGELGRGPGYPACAPRVTAAAHGYKYLSEHHMDQLDGLLQSVRTQLERLGLPLRNIDDEWGPGQVEFVLDPLFGVAAADAMFLFRSAVKQICRRMGFLATFMSQPRIQGCFASGWHLHQSLTDLATGANMFGRAEREMHPSGLSDVGRHFVGGLLKHAEASSVFATPTVTGYRRRRVFSLAPDRATWGVDHRGVMVRVCEAANPDACHVENRVAEPAANPYLHMAAQAFAGLDGIRSQVNPGPLSADPYRDVDRPLLPASLQEGLDALKADEFYRARFGATFVEHMIRQKESELARFAQAQPEGTAHDGLPEEVTEWEEREYFELL